MNLPIFVGEANPVIADDWVQEIEELLGVLESIEDQKVRFATFKLVREAKRRWRSAKMVEEQRPKLTSITWSHFKEVFFDRYFLTATQEAKVYEFLHLTQGPMTIQQYAVRFVELSRFTPHKISDEPRKAWLFERGLR
ncbi:uncharacterized protein LOC131148264 [Malania oleifera]|uniref:uncharacterized protein LOC131148264 n=1 Tax=Malania oleifera TaxID=397392 RepID=UPI0025AE246D|nr:uncharacterized protein LOC131148264 [Malania oleifera]